MRPFFGDNRFSSPETPATETRDSIVPPAWSCPFCSLPESRVVDGDDLALVVRDAFPVSQGHTLIVPRRHVASFFSVTQEERASIVRLLDRAQVTLRCDHAPDGYNIGINDGLAAGQTVPQLHIHLIPRYIGDHDDPRGGVRWVLPGKAKYWS